MILLATNNTHFIFSFYIITYNKYNYTNFNIIYIIMILNDNKNKYPPHNFLGIILFNLVLKANFKKSFM